MPRFTKGDVVVETTNAREAVQLRAAGFVEAKARTKAVREADEAKSADADAKNTKK